MALNRPSSAEMQSPGFHLTGKNNYLSNNTQQIHLNSCFSSPIPRAYKTACIIWDSRDGPLYKLDELKEANLGFLQGLKNSITNLSFKFNLI